MKPRVQRSGLLVQPVGDQLVLFDRSRQRLHVLSRTSALVWRHCDGEHTVAELVALVGDDLGAPVDESVIRLALAQFDEARLLEHRLAPASDDAGLSRRELLHRAAALAAGILLPTIISCGVPTDPTAFAGASLSMLDLDTTTTTSAPPNTTTTTSAPPNTTTTTSAPPSTTTTTSTPPTTTTTTSTPPTTTTTTPIPKKVAMCHQGRTIMVDQRAVRTHLAHGDTLGPCPK